MWPMIEHVGARQWVGEKVAGREAQAVGESVSGDISVEDRLHGRQIEAAAGQMLVRASRSRPGRRPARNRCRSRCRSHAKGTWPLSPPRRTAEAAHRAANPASFSGSAYSVAKKSPPVFTSLCGCPVRRASVSDPQNPYRRVLRHLQHPAHIRGFGRVEEELGRRGVRVRRRRCAQASRARPRRRRNPLRCADAGQVARAAPPHPAGRPRESTPNNFSSTALSSVFEPQNAVPAA